MNHIPFRIREKVQRSMVFTAAILKEILAIASYLLVPNYMKHKKF